MDLNIIIAVNFISHIFFELCRSDRSKHSCEFYFTHFYNTVNRVSCTLKSISIHCRLLTEIEVSIHNHYSSRRCISNLFTLFLQFRWSV